MIRISLRLLAAAVLCAPLVAGCAARAQPAPKSPHHPRTAAHAQPGGGECTVSFRIAGLNTVQALGEVRATIKEPAFGQTYTADVPTGPAVTVPCGSAKSPVEVTLTESPSAQAKAFLGWTVSGDAGRYSETRIGSRSFTFNLTGDTQVYADYSH